MPLRVELTHIKNMIHLRMDMIGREGCMTAITIPRTNVAETDVNKSRSLPELVLTASVMHIQVENNNPPTKIQSCADGAGRSIDLADQMASITQNANAASKIVLFRKTCRSKVSNYFTPSR